MAYTHIRANQLNQVQEQSLRLAQNWLAENTQGELSSDARKLVAGDVFVAYAFDAQHDGRAYVEQAQNNGAAAVLWQDDGVHIMSHTKNLGIPELNALAGHIAHEYYGQPSQAMDMVAITGTNGKTSCAQWLAQFLTASQKKCALMGTLGVGFIDAMVETGFTTPQAIEVHRLLRDVYAQGAHATVMEISSHALEQGRVNGVAFDVALFTNLSRDHLDYHGDMASYEAAKSRLFTWNHLKSAVINTDDLAGQRMAAIAIDHGIHVIGYGLNDRPKDISEYLQASNISAIDACTEFVLHTSTESFTVKSTLVGDFNVMNLLGVLGVMSALDFKISSLIPLCESLSAAPGRMQRFGGIEQPLVVVDFAHTPDALAKTLSALIPIVKQRQGRLICIFGCGGDRDTGKRPKMGALAAQLSDQVWVTSDNPRSENPNTIVEEIAQGTHAVGANAQIILEVDRRTAIAKAIAQANHTDVVLIAGKGHEAYQEINGIKYPYSDLTEVNLALTQWKSYDGDE